MRLARRAQLVVIHDSHYDDADWPLDWRQSRAGDRPVFAGRRTFSDKKVPWTTIIQGDLDKNGTFFEEAKRKVIAKETSSYSKRLNPHDSPWGTHISVLSAAALSTMGDMLECGTGLFSTPLLHDIAAEQGHILVSTDTELNWLYQFRNLSGPGHQIIGIPVYDDGASCGHYSQNTALDPLDFDQISAFGNVEKKLTNNHDIVCPLK